MARVLNWISGRRMLNLQRHMLHGLVFQSRFRHVTDPPPLMVGYGEIHIPSTIVERHG